MIMSTVDTECVFFVDSSSDIILVSDDDSAASSPQTQRPTVDSARFVGSSKRVRSYDENQNVSESKRQKPVDVDDSSASPPPPKAQSVDSTQSPTKPKSNLFDVESSDDDTAARRQAATETLTESVPTVVRQHRKPKWKQFRKTVGDVIAYNIASDMADYLDIDLNVPPFTPVCEVFNRLKLLPGLDDESDDESDDDGDDVFSDDDDMEDDVDDKPTASDNEFINDGSDDDVDTHDDGDVSGEDGVSTRNIINGKRQSKQPERYIQTIGKTVKKLYFADVPRRERRHAHGQSEILSDNNY